MPTYAFEGRVCGEIHEKYLPLSLYTEHIKCPCPNKKCIMADLTILPRGWDHYNQQLSGIVYFEDAAGKIEVAGSSLDPTPKGFVRKEANTLGQMRSIELRMTAEQRSIRQQFVEREQAHMEKVISENRRELRGYMESFSEKGKHFANEMMRYNNHRPNIYTKKVDPNVYLHVLNNDQRK